MKPWDNTRIYKVIHIVEVKERSELKKSTLTFDMALSCTDRKDSIRRQFTKEKILINSKQPEDHHMILLTELEQAVYPLEIKLNSYGNFQKLPSHNLWYTQWKKKSEEILKNKYQGDFAESLKNQVEETLNTEEKLKQKLQQEAFWRIYLFNISESEADRQFRWNLLKGGTIHFKGEVKEQIEEEHKTAEYKGQLVSLEEAVVENINQLLGRQKNTSRYLTSGQMEGHCNIQYKEGITNTILLNKNIEVQIQSKNKEYQYTEKLEITYHSVSLRKTENAQAFNFVVSENKV